jgi:hypothetical protein
MDATMLPPTRANVTHTQGTIGRSDRSTIAWYRRRSGPIGLTGAAGRHRQRPRSVPPQGRGTHAARGDRCIPNRHRAARRGDQGLARRPRDSGRRHNPDTASTRPRRPREVRPGRRRTAGRTHYGPNVARGRHGCTIGHHPTHTPRTKARDGCDCRRMCARRIGDRIRRRSADTLSD